MRKTYPVSARPLTLYRDLGHLLDVPPVEKQCAFLSAFRFMQSEAETLWTLMERVFIFIFAITEREAKACTVGPAEIKDVQHKMSHALKVEIWKVYSLAFISVPCESLV